MKITLVRHGESQGNATGDYSTDDHDQLSATGHEQAARLAERLAGQEFTALYCSPLLRAMQTMRPYAESVDRRVEVWPELAESCWQAEGRDAPLPESWRHEPSQAVTESDPHFAFRDNRAVVSVEHQTFAEGLLRVRDAVELLKARHAGSDDHVLIVSHGFTLSKILEYLLELPTRHVFDHDNTAITRVHECPKGFRIDFVNRI